MGMKVNRPLDKMGRIVIPSDFREALNLQPESRVSVEVGKDCLIITAASKLCTVCGKSVEKRHHTEIKDGKYICFDCAQSVARAMMK